MAKYSKKIMGKEVGDASVYAEPHDMKGNKMKIESNPGKTTSSIDPLRMSVGNVLAGKEASIKTTGIKIRGTGAATKGVMARGPMA